MKIGQAVWQKYSGSFSQVVFGIVIAIDKEPKQVHVKLGSGQTETWPADKCHKVRDSKMANFVRDKIVGWAPDSDSRTPDLPDLDDES